MFLPLNCGDESVIKQLGYIENDCMSGGGGMISNPSKGLIVEFFSKCANLLVELSCWVQSSAVPE